MRARQDTAKGHNSGVPLNITAAIAVKRIMEREKLSGTLVLWPGIAEEQLGTKAYYVREGVFKDVDIVLYNHVGSNLGTGWGESGGNGLISVEYTFDGETAHSAGAPWRGRSAHGCRRADERRLELSPRAPSHSAALSLRRHQRRRSAERRAEQRVGLVLLPRDVVRGHQAHVGDRRQHRQRRSDDDGHDVQSRVLGSAWPSHMNRTLAETMHKNIARLGLPKWTEADVTLAKALQRELKVPETGLATEIRELRGRESMADEEKRGGGSDDIGDISWNVPTVSLSFPANIQAGPGHNWANAIAMATPIAHKGVVAGAKAQAMTVLDILMRPEITEQAWDYFRNVQTKDRKYTPLDSSGRQASHLAERRDHGEVPARDAKYYYDPTKYKTYLDQLGIKYPTVRESGAAMVTGQ